MAAPSIDPIVPVRIYPQHEEQIIAQIIQMKAKYGLRRVAVLAPDKTIRFTGLPDVSAYREIGELILRARQKLEPHDIEVSWECSATIKHGPGAPFQQVTGLDGKTSDISFCPLDRDFQKYLTDAIGTVVSIARPVLLTLEDDYTLRHAGGVGCSCPLHLAEFARRQGREVSREELRQVFSERTCETLPLRRAWTELTRDSLVELATHIRQKIDTIAPQTRVMLCQPGSADLEGNMTEPVARALAGKTQPAVRLFGVDYGSDNALALPQVVFHALYCVQHLPKDFELFHESDTFPHTRFFASSTKIKSVMTTAYAYGMTNSRFHPTQNTDSLLEETGYAEMFHKQHKRFDALCTAVADGHVDGCEVVYDPAEQIASPSRRSAWANVLGRLGMPHTARGGKVKMVSGTSTDVMSDDEVRELLSGSVFLDGRAALALHERGFGELIGSSVAPGQTPAFLYESIREDAGFTGITGRIMYNFLFFGSVGPEGGAHVELAPAKGAQVLTDFCSDDEKPVMPGMIRFENKLGGRVVITAYDLKNNGNSGIINYKKKEMMRQLIEWLGREPLPVFVKDAPNVFPIFSRSASGDQAVLVLINLCSDTLDAVALDVAPQWQGANVELMDAEGQWQSAPVAAHGKTLNINAHLPLLSPMVLRLTR